MGQCTIPNEPGWIELYNYFTTQQVLLVPSGFHGFREEFKQDIVVVLKNLCKQFRKNMNSSVKKPANSCLQTRQVWIFKKHGDLWQDIQDVHRSPFKTWWMVRRPHGSSLMVNPAGHHFLAACSFARVRVLINNKHTSLTKTSSISGTCRV